VVRPASDPEVEAIVSLCQNARVIFDAETFAALAATKQLAAAAAALGQRLAHVSSTASIFHSDALVHICREVVDVARYSSPIEPFDPKTALGRRLVLGAQADAMAKNWDSEWSPPRAAPVILSLIAGRTHKHPVVTAYPNARRLGGSAGGFRIVATPEVAIFMAHKHALAPADAGALAVELGFLTDPKRLHDRGCRARWDGQLEDWVNAAAEAAQHLLCPIP